jgi:hypothetical protein
LVDELGLGIVVVVVVVVIVGVERCADEARILAWLRGLGLARDGLGPSGW